MVRFASLGSGSKGNATLISGGGVTLLVDCGLPLRELTRRCDLLGFDPDEVDAVLVTHEHGDHSRGVGAFARRHRKPVWMTHGTARSANFGRLPELQAIHAHGDDLCFAELKVTPFAVPHDASEPCQFVFEADGRRLGLLTDLGCITPTVRGHMSGLHGAILECNHDARMLDGGPYPRSLKDRVGGGFGHLSNHQAADLLADIDHAELGLLCAAHLSEQNNQPELVRKTLSARVSGLEQRLHILSQEPMPKWFTL